MKRYKYLIWLFLISTTLQAQTNMLQLGDTVKTEYPYIFPILGRQAHEKGFELPLPAGIMVNYFLAEQEIAIPEIGVGFSGSGGANIPLTDVTRLIEFKEINARATTINVRPDLWVFPFLNVYGIFGKTWSQTEVIVEYPIEFEAVANLDGNSYGVGVTGASGLGKYFFVLDGNWVWSDLKNFDKPVKSSVFSFRIGRAFSFNDNKKSNIAFWAGAMRVRIGGITEGYIELDNIISDETWERRDEIVADYYQWYESVDAVKQAVADKVFTPVVEKINSADGSGTIHYSLEKEPVKQWNMIVGTQYQINKVWQLRSEMGLLGSRKSILLSVNYRFGI